MAKQTLFSFLSLIALSSLIVLTTFFIIFQSFLYRFLVPGSRYKLPLPTAYCLRFAVLNPSQFFILFINLPHDSLGVWEFTNPG